MSGKDLSVVPVLRLGPSTAEAAHAASLSCAAHALDAEDLRLLLDTLGLP